MIDWSIIETEYVTTNISQRKLAEKHGVSRGRLGEYAKKEHWQEKREKHREQTIQNAADIISVNQANRMAEYVETADILLGKVKQLLRENEEVVRDVSALREISVILKNLKDVQSMGAAEQGDGGGVILIPAIKEESGNG